MACSNTDLTFLFCQGSAGQRFLREACIFLGCCLWWIPVCSNFFTHCSQRTEAKHVSESSPLGAGEGIKLAVSEIALVSLHRESISLSHLTCCCVVGCQQD